MLTRVTVGVFCALFLALGCVQPAQADKKRVADLARDAAGDNPDDRARAIEDLCALNNADAAKVIVATLESEKDGPAGFRMADAVANLTDPDALKLVGRTVRKWNRPESLMGAYWLLTGLANQRSNDADEVLGELASDVGDRDVYLGAAFIEALATAGRKDFGHILPALLEDYSSKWDTDRWLFALTVLTACPRMTCEEDNATRLKVVSALADVLEKSEDDRVRWFTSRALADITGMAPFVQPEYWRWWVKVEGRVSEDSPAVDRKTSSGAKPPSFFNAEAVGKRVVLVIDVSGSMQSPVSLVQDPEDPEPEGKGPVSGKRKGDRKEREEAPKPDYSGVKTKLDLAKVELIFTLRHLPDDYLFNIVTYGSTHSMIDPSRTELVKATERNKQRFIRKVEKLTVGGATNIHGALNRAFCINEKKSLNPRDMVDGRADPASDTTCLLTGATTIYFLTDGSPNVSDGKTQPDRTADPFARPRFTIADNIIAEVRRLNKFRRTVIHTVGIGPHPKDLMKGLADATGGTYIDRSGQPAE